MSWPVDHSWPADKSSPIEKSWPEGNSWPGGDASPPSPGTVTLNAPGQLYGEVPVSITGTYVGAVTDLAVYLN